MAQMQEGTVQAKAERFEILHRVGVLLGAEKNRERLLALILEQAQALCKAEGGSLYLRNASNQLEFSIVRNSALKIDLGGISGREINFPPIMLFNENGSANLKNIASYAVHHKKPLHIADAYNVEGFDFSGTKDFDARSGYRSISFFTVPLINSEEQVIGVLQLLNATNSEGRVVEFDQDYREIVTAMAAQAALALDNKLLFEAQKSLLESFIQVLATAIDSKSPYTGGHCERVPVLTEMLVHSLCEEKEGVFAEFKLDEEEWYELRIAAWLHDCGKVTTPTHVMDKASKLETIFDRIALVDARFEILLRDAELQYLRNQLSQAEYESLKSSLDSERIFLRDANVGGEYLSPERIEKIRKIAERKLSIAEKIVPLLTEEERLNLSVSKGTLTPDERLIINGHMVQTVRMLEELPFPRNLQRVPEYASGHHEKMDGSGYPKGIFAGDMSVPARAMAIADVFEALTAHDRPYKKAKTLSEAMTIMGFMKKDNHLDPEIFDHFVKSGVYREYAQQFLEPNLIDQVEEAKLLAIEPKPFSMPALELRAVRKQALLPEYEQRFPRRPPLRGALEAKNIVGN